MTIDDWLVVSAGGAVAALVGLAIFQTPGSALLIGLVVVCALCTIVRDGRAKAGDHDAESPPNR